MAAASREEQSSSARLGGRALPWALGFFILVKLCWTLLPTVAMGVPRLGDDALVYLWKGVTTVVTPHTGAPALQEIVRLRADPAPTPELDAAKARVTMRTTGTTASPLLIILGGLLRAGMSDKTAFAVMEAGIAVCLGLSIAFMLSRMVSGPGAAIALCVLALAILPNQGLHYLVPSVMELSIAMVLWTLMSGSRARPIPILLLATALLLIHPIGPVYVLVALALAAAKSLIWPSVRRVDLVNGGVLVAAWPIWRLLETGLRAQDPMTSGLGGVLFSALAVNAQGLLGHLKVMVATQPLVSSLTLLGLALAIFRPRRHPQSTLLVVILAGVVVSTLVVNIPGYPGELPSRALIALVIVCCGAAAGQLWDWLAGWSHARAWLAAFLLVAWGTQAPQFVDQAFANINSRHQIYDPALLAQEVAALPPGAVIVWTETDIALMAGLLAGADRYRAIPYSMISDAAELRQSLSGATSVLVATATPERLNGLSTIGAWSLEPRYYGYGFDAFSRVTMYAGQAGRQASYLRLEGPDPVHGANVSSGLQKCKLTAADLAGWYRIEDCGTGGPLQVASDDGGLRLTGLSIAEPDARRPWPWGEAGLRLRAEPRAQAEAAELRFDFSYLLGASTAARLESELGPLELLSCRSGIVWLRAVPAIDRKS